MYVNKNDEKILDVIRAGVDDVALPAFWKDDEAPVRDLSDNIVFQMIAEKRAYSAAQSRLVEKMINNGNLRRAFKEYDISQAISLTREEVLDHHWPEIKVIRFKWKVEEIIETAKAICKTRNEFGSFINYLNKIGLPRRIRHVTDIEGFWDDFDKLLSDLKSRGIPILCKEVTLLHFLESDLRLDSIKPDTIVMQVLMNTGIIPSKTRSAKRLAIKKLQEYCLMKGLRTQVMDRYILAFGGQTWAKDVVSMSFCGSRSDCDFQKCPVGKEALCPPSINRN